MVGVDDTVASLSDVGCGAGDLGAALLRRGRRGGGDLMYVRAMVR
jgi:16S rRNA G1207 methylase RsmC